MTPFTIRLFVVASLAGTACFGPKSDPTTFWVLTPVVAPVAGSGPVGPSVGLGPVTVPEYLARPQIVTRVDEHQVLVDEFSRWAEPLDDMLAATLAEQIRAEVRPVSLVRYPWRASQIPDLSVRVQVSRFEPGASGDVLLQATWQVVDRDGKQLSAHTGEYRVPAGQTVKEAVAAMSTAAERLGKEISGALRAR
jgi:uncharacterized lipoprotein YmbA